MAEETKSVGKKSIWWIFTIIIVVAVGLILVYSSNQSPTVSPTGVQNPSATTNTSQNNQDITALVRKAIDSRDSGICQQIQDAAGRQSCLNNVIITKASDAKDSSICGQLSDSYWKTACTDNIIIVKARDAKNPSLCLSLVEKDRIPSCEATAK